MTEVTCDEAVARTQRSSELDDLICDCQPGPNDFSDRDDETRTVVTLLSLINGGFSEGRKHLATVAAEQSGVSFTFALSVIDRETGRHWSCRRVGPSLLYRLLPA